MAALAVRGPLVLNCEEVEVLACSKALEFVVDVGFVELIIEGDNKSIMRNISRSQPNSSHLGHLYGDIQCLCTGLRAM